MNSASPSLVVSICAAAILGFALGLQYFRWVRRTVDLYGSKGNWMLPIAFTVGRIAMAAGVLWLVAQLGVGPLLSASAGFLLARARALGTRRGLP